MRGWMKNGRKEYEQNVVTLCWTLVMNESLACHLAPRMMRSWAKET